MARLLTTAALALSVGLTLGSLPREARATKPTRTATLDGVTLLRDGDGFVVRWLYRDASGSATERAQRLDARGRPVGPRVNRSTPWAIVTSIDGALFGIAPAGTGARLTRVTSSLDATGPSRDLPFSPDRVLALSAGFERGVNLVARGDDGATSFLQLRGDLSDAAPTRREALAEGETVVAGAPGHWLTIEASFVAPSGLARKVIARRRAPSGALVGEPREVAKTTNEEGILAFHATSREDADLVILPIDRYDGQPSRIDARAIAAAGAQEVRDLGAFGGDGRAVSIFDRGASLVVTSHEGPTDGRTVHVRTYNRESLTRTSGVRVNLEPGTMALSTQCSAEVCVLLTAGGLGRSVVGFVAVDASGTVGSTLDETPALDEGGCSASPRRDRAPSSLPLAALALVLAAALRRATPRTR